MERFINDIHPFIWSAAGIVAAVAIGAITYAVAFVAVDQVARRTDSRVDDMLVRNARGPSRIMFPLMAVLLAAPVLRLSPELDELLRRLIALGITGCSGWYVLSLINFIADLAADRFRIDRPDNLLERQIRTRVQVFRRISAVIVVVVTAAVMLMTIPSVRHLGVSLFASAGVAGIVIGFAARSALSNLVAGIQIALTAPIRIDDVVIVEGEWGWIEEITTSYVIVRIWDLRRLVVPLSYFIERPFQNWTRKTADILGTVIVYTDYTVDVDALRDALHRILHDSGLWDGKVWGLQVTNATESTLELRALMSAPDSGQAWTLRCHVREKLLGHLRAYHPDSLPRTRAELHSGPGPPAPDAIAVAAG